ncbi:glutathione S-transferase family protein [soil metagenome]
MAITVYGDSISGNCLKVKFVCDRLGIAYSGSETGVLDGSTRTPEFLALNPVGQVPLVVLEDGRPLAQSNAILLHLGEGSDLIPADAYDRARMHEWLFWEQYNHETSIAVRRFRVRYQGLADADIDPQLKVRGDAALARMQLQLTQTAYLVGDALSLADLSLVAYTRLAHEGGFDLSQFPAVAAWVRRFEADLGLPSWA